MKKKVISMLLSITMCLTAVVPAGAADFSSESAVLETEAETAFEEEDPERPEEEEIPVTEGGDIFSAGEEKLPEVSGDGFGDLETEETPEETPEEDIFSAEAVEEEIPSAQEGEIAVKAEDWVEDGEHFKLRRTTAKMVSEAAVPAAETEDAESEVEEQEIPETEAPETEEETVPSADAVSEFYTEADGILYVATEYKGITHKGYYLFDANGYMVEGRKIVKAGTLGQTNDTELYFKDSFYNAKYYEADETGSKTPYNSDRGQQLFNSWTWYEDQVFRFYDENGRFMSVTKLDEIYKSTDKYTGYYKIGDDYYCLEADGTPKTGDITLTVGSSSGKYYFIPDKDPVLGIYGKMARGWQVFNTEKGERWVYYNQGVTVPADLGKALERGIIATRLDVEKKGNYTYLIDKNGYLIKSKMQKAANGKYYCTDSRGVVYKEKLVKYKGNRYYFTASGVRAAWKNMWHVCKGASNRYYYFGSSAGRVIEKKGWQKIPNSKGKFAGWFYFPSNGNHYINQLTSEGYYFTSTGKLAGGIQEVNGKKYLFAESDEKTHRGKMYVKTLIHYRNRWYYADSKGVLRKSGWQNVKGSYYYFDDYKAVTKKFIKRNGVNGYLDANGKFTTGWVIVSNGKNQVRYINPDGTDFVKNGSKWIDGLLYYFDKDGYRINDVTNLYKAPYYFTVDRINGVMTVYNSAKTVPVKSIRVSVGRAATPTPTGTYSLTAYSRWQPLMGPSWGQYGTHVDGAGQGGIFVHSIACPQPNSYNLPASAYNMLGNPASHGCIRACVADAKWVYDNSRGGTIRIFDGKANSNEAMKGPLGRRARVPLKAPYNYDPTDPAV